MTSLIYNKDNYYFVHNLELKGTTFLNEYKRKTFKDGIEVVGRRISTFEKLILPDESEANLLNYLKSQDNKDLLQFLIIIPKSYFEYDKNPQPIFKYMGKKSESGELICKLDPSFVVGVYEANNGKFISNPNYGHYDSFGLLFNDPKDHLEQYQTMIDEDFLIEERHRCKFKNYKTLRLFDILNTNVSDVYDQTPKQYIKK